MKTETLKARRFATAQLKGSNANGTLTTEACSSKPNGEVFVHKEISTAMKPSAAAKRLAKRLRATGVISPLKRPPSEREIDNLEREIRDGGSVSQRTSPEIAAILKRFARSCCAIRELVTASSQLAATQALQHLIDQTTDNVRCIEKVPDCKLQYFASQRTSFPMLISVGQNSPKRINDRIRKLELGSNIAPGFKVNARWKRDIFGFTAMEILQNLYHDGIVPDDISLQECKALCVTLRKGIGAVLDKDMEFLEELAAYLTAARDKRNKSAKRERIIERVLERFQSMIGLKALR